MPVSDHEEFGVNLHVRPFSDSVTGVPIKKRRFMLVQPADCDLPQKSSEPESSVPEIGNQSASWTALISKVSSESRVESIVSTDMDVKGAINMKELTPDSKCALSPLTGNGLPLPAKESFEQAVKEGSGEGKIIQSDTSPFYRLSGSTEFQLKFKDPFGLPDDGQNREGCSVKQEKLDSCSWDLALGSGQQNPQRKCSDVASKVDSAYVCLKRSSWDLNTTMDTWEGTDGHDSSDLGGIHKKSLGPCAVQNLYKEPDGAEATLRKCVLEKSDHHLTPPMDKVINSEANLNLQLKPSSMADSIKEIPPLSLSVAPSSSCNLTLADCRAVKAEPCEEGGKKDTRKTEVGGSGPAGLKHVKFELCEVQESTKGPCEKRSQKDTRNTEVGGKGFALPKHVKFEPREVQESPKGGHSGDLKSECRMAVKSEPQSSLAPQSTGTLHDVSEHVDKALQSLVPDAYMPHDGPQMPHTNITLDLGQAVGKSRELDIQMPFHSNETHRGGMVSESSDLVEKPLVSEGKELYLVMEAHKTAGLALDLPSESSLCDAKEHVVADGNSEVVAQLSCVEDHNSSKDAAESSEGRIGLSAEVLDNPCDLQRESNSSHETVGSVVTVHKPVGHDGYEDGEVRDPALHNPTVGSCEKREENPVEDADSIHPIDIPVEVTSHVNSKADNIGNSVDYVQCSDKNARVISTTPNLHESSADELHNAGSGKRRLRKTIRNIPQDPLKGKGIDRKPKSDRAPNATAVTEGGPGELGNQQENTSGSDPLLAKVSVPSKTELPLKDDAKNIGNDRNNTPRIIYLNPAPNGLASGKTKSIPRRSLSSRIERKRLISLRRDNFRSRRIRNERWNHGPRVFESEGKDLPVGRRRPDMMHIRNRANNQLNALRGDRNSDHEHLSEQADSSTSGRFPRPTNASEVAVATASDGYIPNAGRMARKLTGDGLQTPSHMPCRRQPPGARGRIPVGSRMVRPHIRDSYMGRDVPDFVLQDHEENFMRILPDDMMAPPMVPHQRTQYERAEGSLIRRDRRSLSPVQRSSRLHFPLRSPRSRHQWSPPSQSPDGFDEHTELMSCRSPKVGRPYRIESPHQHPCFAEDMIVRRRGSPPYLVRLPDNVGIGPSRERGFPRPLRGLQRNVRRFGVSGPREISEEEYFEPLIHNQFGELAGDVECSVDRSCDEMHERRVIGRPFRQRRIVGDGDDESFRSNVGGSGSQPIRFCPEGNKGFPERGSRREFDGHIRNRLGSPAGRLRGIEEQEDEYGYDGEPGWCDTGFNDARLKKRRFERR